MSELECLTFADDDSKKEFRMELREELDIDNVDIVDRGQKLCMRRDDRLASIKDLELSLMHSKERTDRLKRLILTLEEFIPVEGI